LIASKVLTSWELPPNICQAIAYCQTPELAPPEHIIIAGLTQFAYAIVEQSKVGSSGDGLKQAVSDTYFGKNPKLKIGQPEVQKKLVAEIHQSIQAQAENITSIPRSKTGPQTKRITVGKSRVQQKRKKVPEKKGVIGWVKSLWG